MARFVRAALGGAAAFALALAPAGTGSALAARDTVESDAITFGAATWVDLQRVTGADPVVSVDGRGNGRVFVDFPWGRLTTPQLPNIVARSLDGGDTFRTLFDETCPTGNSQPHCGDPGFGNSALALSPDSDNAYLAGIAPGFTGITASASADAGDTWPHFNTLTSPAVMDRPWLVSPGKETAYLTWNNATLLTAGLPSAQYATTTDGGKNWTVDPDQSRKYRLGGGTRLVTDRSEQSPAHGAVYQIFGDVDPVGNPLPRAAIAVSLDGTKSFVVHPVGDDLPAGDTGDGYRGYSLPWVTTDTAGNLYAVWSTADGSDVVMRTSLISDPANDPRRPNGSPGTRWSAPVRVSTGAAETAVVGNVVAGSPGNVAVVYYGTNGTGIPDSQPDTAVWHAFVAHSADALAARPTYTQSVIDHRPPHVGGYCTNGFGSCPEGFSQERGLRNWMNVGFDADGRLYAAWSDDHNAGRRTAIRFAKQATGPSMIAGKPAFADRPPNGPMDDPVGDATWKNRVGDGTNLPGADLTRVGVGRRGDLVRVQLTVGDATRFEDAIAAVTPLGGRLLLVVRFETADQEYFAAYEYTRGGGRRAFTGRIDDNDHVGGVTSANAIDFAQDDPALSATVSGNTLTITQSASVLGGRAAPVLSVVGASLIGPASAAETTSNLLNTIDATRAYDR
ncbi:hypothetical protein [Streptomyces sp. NPDC127092]|uniref:hypothetical protein n=1 Tax=Streptomyces sp. NPDC127092 TaxID=3347135 RepID=UPI00364B1AE7